MNGADADRIDVTRGANLAGTVQPNVIDVGSATQWAILTTRLSPITNNGITVIDTAAVDFELVFPNPNEMDLAIARVSFVLEGQNRNQQAIANNLNKAFAAGVPPSMQGLFTALVNLPTAGAVAAALDQLLPEIYLDTEIATLFSAQNFTII